MRAVSEALRVAQARRDEAAGTSGRWTVVNIADVFNYPGDHRFVLVFPQHFTEKPHIGTPIIDLSPLSVTARQPGLYPRPGTPFVLEWDIRYTDEIPRYAGATIGITIDGPPDTRGELIFPVSGPTNVGSTVNPEE